MAVAVCYHARLQDRMQFEEEIVQQFKSPHHIPGGRQQFVKEIFMYVYHNYDLKLDVSNP